MDHELSPDELESLLAAYAIDAVDDDERRAVEEHLRRSPAAEEEVARLREAAAMLAIAGGPPPKGLWEQLEAKLQMPATGRPAAPIIGMESRRAPGLCPSRANAKVIGRRGAVRGSSPSPRPSWRWCSSPA